jgi:hypothetical protein
MIHAHGLHRRMADGDKWEDLDAEDADDPMMVSE